MIRSIEKKCLLLCILIILTSVLSLNNSYGLDALKDVYALEYVINDENIDLKWNRLDDSNVYLLLVLEDGVKVFEHWVYDTKYTIKIKDFKGELLTFKVSAPGKNFSEELIFINKYNEKPICYAPAGPSQSNSSNKVYFSWSKTKGAEYYVFELFSDCGKSLKSDIISNKKVYISVDDIKKGAYKWRVIPFTKLNKRGIPSEWSYFSLFDEPMEVENILGLEKNLVTSPLNTSLTYPECAILGPDGSLYVSDTHANVIRRVSEGKSDIYVGTLLSNYNGDGNRLSINIDQPGGINFDSQGNLIFSDMGNKMIRKVDMKTNEVTTLYKHNYWVKNFKMNQDGSLVLFTDSGKVIQVTDAQEKVILENEILEYPVEVLFHEKGVYILDNKAKKLMLFENDDVKKEIKLTSNPSTIFIKDNYIYLGEGTAVYRLDLDLSSKKVFSDHYANVAHISFDKGIGFIITDSDSGCVYSVDENSGVKTTVVGTKLASSAIVDIEKYGNYLFLLDNQSACVWRYNILYGTIERYVGNGIQEMAKIGSNRLETGLFYPAGLAVDNYGNLYISEQHHILKVSSKTDVIEIFAGALGRDKYGYNGENVEAKLALFQSIRGLSYDVKSQSLYVADTYNNRIRKVKNGVVTTVAGDGVTGEPFFGKLATDVHLTKPHDVIVVDDGIIISDSWNNNISKVSKNGRISHIAGKVKYTGYQGNGSFNGDVSKVLEGELNTPHNLFYHDRILYISDTFNNRIRVIVDNNMYTLIGSEFKGYSSMNPMVLNMPMSIYVDDKYVYVADTGNFLLRRYNKSKLGLSIPKYSK